MEKLVSIIGIKRGEEKLAGLSALYALFIGLSQVWLKTIPVSLFLTHFNATTLPYAYIASAILLVAFGIIYGALEKKVSVTQLLYIFIIFPAAFFFIFWFFLQTSPSHGLYLILFIFSAAGFDIFDLELWGMLNRLFTLDQAKRMFGAIGLCQTLAGITGNLLIPFLLVFIGADNVILGISICVSCATLLLSVIFRTFPNRFHNPAPKHHLEENKKVKWINNSYLINNMLFAMFSLFVYTIVDITFYNVNKKVFPTEIQLASFLGIFFATINSFDLLCRGVIAPLVINKLGVRVGLLIRSLAVGGVALTLLFLTPFNIKLHTIFLLVALMKLFDEGIANSILRQSVLILYQPLLPRLRSWLQSKVELLIIPLSTISASLIFILIQYYFSLDLVYITLLILILVAATLWVTFSLQKGFIDNLKLAITKQFFLFKSQILDKNSQKFILEKLMGGKPDEVVYCLDLLEKTKRSYFVQGLSLCLEHPNSLIKQAALKKLQHFQSNKLVLKIKKILDENPDPYLRAQAFLALIFQKSTLFDKNLQSYFDYITLVFNDGAILASLQSNLDTTLQQEIRERVFKIIYSKSSKRARMAQQIIQNKLFNLIHSTSTFERVRAAKILGQLGIEKDPSQDLLLLFADKNPSVVLSVIEVIPSFQDKKLYQQLAKALNQNELRSAVTLAFIKAKDKGLPSLEDSLNLALEQQDFKMTNSIFKIIGYLQTSAASQVLLQHLRATNNLTLQWQILHALDICGYQANMLSEKEELNPFLINTTDHLNKVLKWIRQIGNRNGYELLTATLIRHIQSSLQQIFLLLRLLYSRKMIGDIAFYFKHENLDKVSYAHELLENILGAEHKKILFPLLKERNSDKLILKQPSTLDIEVLFKEILACPTSELTKILKSTVIYLIAYHQLRQFTQAVLAATGDADEMVSETAKWTLTKLNPGSHL